MFKDEGEWENVVGGLTKMKAARKSYMEASENFNCRNSRTHIA